LRTICYDAVINTRQRARKKLVTKRRGRALALWLDTDITIARVERSTKLYLATD
jgi:hypothetical protein